MSTYVLTPSTRPTQRLELSALRALMVACRDGVAIVVPIDSHSRETVYFAECSLVEVAR